MYIYIYYTIVPTGYLIQINFVIRTTRMKTMVLLSDVYAT